jgi:hypothetical protein
MRYAIISDIHGNLEALEATLTVLDRRGYDALLVLGDLVGYGADPNAVTDRVRDRRWRDPRQSRHAAGVDGRLQRVAACRSGLETLTPSNRTHFASFPKDRWSSTIRSRFVMIAVRRRRGTCSTPDGAARAEGDTAARVLFGHTPG